jgi:hypothetical protein
MKLLVITCLKEYLSDVAEIFKQGNIEVFSTSDIIGHRNGASHNILEDWFVSGGEKVESIMIFTFTSEENAAIGLKLVKEYNETTKSDFPIRAFIMPVDQSV